MTEALALTQRPAWRALQTHYEQIKEWQDRIKKEGWKEGLVDDVINHCILLSKYRSDGEKDQWDMPHMFIQQGFQGDCEDIATFMWATLKRLEYPRHIRILVVKTLLGDHTVVKVELPQGKWKMYETVPVPLDQFDHLFFIPIVEFDDKVIIYYKRQRS